MARIVWSDEAERVLIQIPPNEAEAILDATEQVAATGRGFVRNMLDGFGTLGLYVGGYVVLFLVDDDGDLRVPATPATPAPVRQTAEHAHDPAGVSLPVVSVDPWLMLKLESGRPVQLEVKMRCKSSEQSARIGTCLVTYDYWNEQLRVRMGSHTAIHLDLVHAVRACVEPERVQGVTRELACAKSGYYAVAEERENAP
jgi:hypothetical protein